MNLGHDFAQPELLTEALTHSSFSHERSGSNNERLEFLGDSILNMCTTLLIFELRPGAPEGELTRLRSRLVGTANLADIGRALNLGAQMRLGRGEELTGGRDKDKLLEDAVEAIVGAIYLDSGLDACRAVVTAWMQPRLQVLIDGQDASAWKDPRSQLQELTQGTWQLTPDYVVVAEEGPSHQPTFRVEVRAGSRVLGVGEGSKKKEASKAAARDALVRLKLGDER